MLRLRPTSAAGPRLRAGPLTAHLTRLGPPGLWYMAGGAFFFSWMSVGVKFAGQRLPSQQIVLVRGLITLVLSYALVRNAGVPLWGRRRRYLVLRGVLGFAALSCFYWSLTHLPLADASLLQYTNPVWTALLAAVLLGERMGRREICCVAASLLGTLLVVRPSFLFGGSSRIPLGAAVVALFGALLSAGAYVTVRRLQGEHPLTIVFYLPVVTVAGTIPVALPSAVWPTSREWAWLIAIGACTQIAQVFMTRGLQREPAGRATAVGYLQVVFAMAWGALLFGEHLTSWQLAGAALVLASTLTLSRPPAPDAE